LADVDNSIINDDDSASVLVLDQRDFRLRVMASEIEATRQRADLAEAQTQLVRQAMDELRAEMQRDIQRERDARQQDKDMWAREKA
jgi:hypothetical protein